MTRAGSAATLGHEGASRRPTPSAHPSTDPATRLAALGDITRVVARARDHEDVLVAAARAARLALGGSAVSLSIWERDLGQLRTILNEGSLAPWEQAHPHDEVYSVRHAPELHTTLTRGEGYVVSAAQEFGARATALLLELGKGSALNLPVMLEGQVWGTIWVSRDSDQPDFEDSDLEYGYVVAGQVAAAIAAGLRIAQVGRSAYTDQLTGLANRRAVDQRLDHAFDARAAAGDPAAQLVVSLVVCDVNGLKLLNDERGPEAGDRALVELAGVLSAAAALAPGSLAARLGGDEFCIVLNDHSPDDAVRVAEELCRRAESVLPRGVSCGVASTGDDSGEVRSGSELFRLADAAQYRAKRSSARRPVVAGRSLPVSHDRAAGQGPAENGGRRGPRPRTHDEQCALMVEVFTALDERSTADLRVRVAAVADVLSRHLDAAGWWLSICPAGEAVVRTVDLAMYRGIDSAPHVATGLSQIGSEYALAEFPLTADAVEGQAFCVAVDDPYADPAEVTFLDSTGGVALLIAGGLDRSGDGWLVEIMADEMSRSLHGFTAAARAAMAAALAPRR